MFFKASLPSTNASSFMMSLTVADYQARRLRLNVDKPTSLLDPEFSSSTISMKDRLVKLLLIVSPRAQARTSVWTQELSQSLLMIYDLPSITSNDIIYLYFSACILYKLA